MTMNQETQESTDRSASMSPDDGSLNSIAMDVSDEKPLLASLQGKALINIDESQLAVKEEPKDISSTACGDQINHREISYDDNRIKEEGTPCCCEDKVDSKHSFAPLEIKKEKHDVVSIDTDMSDEMYPVNEIGSIIIPSLVSKSQLGKFQIQVKQEPEDNSLLFKKDRHPLRHEEEALASLDGVRRADNNELSSDGNITFPNLYCAIQERTLTDSVSEITKQIASDVVKTGRKNKEQKNSHATEGSSLASDNTRSIRCPKCNTYFNSYADVELHTTTHEENDHLHPCHLCKKLFKDAISLKKHIKNHSTMKSTNVPPGVKPHICYKCHAGFFYEWTLKQHMILHDGTKTYDCNECEKRFVTPRHLSKHQEIHKLQKVKDATPYLCTVCSKCFASGEELEDHMGIHKKRTPFVCNICGKCLSAKRPLEEHLLTHSVEKPYSCEQCGAGFTRMNSLLAHQSIHSGEKPFDCAECGKSFRNIGSLTLHERTHSTEKLFVCQICEMKFARASNLKRHLRTHTGEKPWVCEICGKPYASKTNYKNHIKTHGEPGEVKEPNRK